MHDGPLVNRHKDTMGQPIRWMKMKVMMYSADEIGKIMCFTSFNQDASPREKESEEHQTGLSPS